VVDAQPDVIGHRITLAAVLLELKQAAKAETALKPVVDAALAKPEAKAEGKPDAPAPESRAEFDQAFLLMAQIAEQKQDLKQAGTWLERADPKTEKISVQGQRARLLAKQGQLPQARALLRGLPESEPRDAVAKVQAEAQLLRDARQWDEAYKVMGEAVQRFPDDTDLIYDQAMLAERLKRYDEMERQLRLVMAAAPDNANAYNALGYSLADRGTRLEEARQLIQKALSIKPGDPFITDSLGWLAYRRGDKVEAIRLLKEAYAARPDPEIAAHLGEALWQQGEHDAAALVWREGLRAEPDNDALKETLQRFKFKP